MEQPLNGRLDRLSRRGACRALAALAMVAAAATPAASASASAYTFVKVADSAEGLDPSGCPAINDDGAIAFSARRDPGVDGVYRPEGQRLTTIVEETAGFDFFGRNPSINEKGSVSFAAAHEDDQGEAILRGRGGPLTTIARTEPGRFNYFGFDTSVNRWGSVAFTAELDAEFGFEEGLFSGRGGGGIRTHYLASTSRFSGVDSGPSLNNWGQVAFFERLDGEDLSPDDPTVNDRGLVAFTAAFVRNDEFVQAIITGKGGPVSTIADTTGDYGSVDNPSLNDGGQVAFVADLDDFVTRGVFTGPDPVADRLVATGEQLEGSTIAGLQFCREGLNDNGELTFAAQLDEGARTAIFRATPRQE